MYIFDPKLLELKINNYKIHGFYFDNCIHGDEDCFSIHLQALLDSSKTLKDLTGSVVDVCCGYNNEVIFQKEMLVSKHTIVFNDCNAIPEAVITFEKL